MMKLLTVLATLALLTTSAFADQHEEEKKKVGHDKEHSHVAPDKVDHGHDEAHHKAHDHKAHHPDHKDEAAKLKKK
jgi:Ni/Co efflux regulator RcnB